MTAVPSFDARSFAWVHYVPETGVIRQKSDGPFDVSGLLLAEVETLPEGGVDILRHKVDLTSIQDGYVVCQLLEVPENEVPKLDWVGRLRIDRNRELDRCDPLMLPHRPMSTENREAWAGYMQVLRDLGQYATAAEWISNWPVRPDGVDAIAELRGGNG